METQDTATTSHTKSASTQKKKDADYVFYELTRSICPECRRVIDAKIILRDNKVYMRKRCPQCGPFEALVYADAEAKMAAPMTAASAPTTSNTPAWASSK